MFCKEQKEHNGLIEVHQTSCFVMGYNVCEMLGGFILSSHENLTVDCNQPSVFWEPLTCYVTWGARIDLEEQAEFHGCILNYSATDMKAIYPLIASDRNYDVWGETDINFLPLLTIHVQLYYDVCERNVIRVTRHAQKWLLGYMARYSY